MLPHQPKTRQEGLSDEAGAEYQQLCYMDESDLTSEIKAYLDVTSPNWNSTVDSLKSKYNFGDGAQFKEDTRLYCKQTKKFAIINGIKYKTENTPFRYVMLAKSFVYVPEFNTE